MKTNLSILSLLLCAGLLCGCRVLTPGGPYNGDPILYRAELAIVTSYEVIHSYVSWEYENRAALSQWPDIKKSADYMRANSKQWISSARALRDAYSLNPSPENRTALERAINILRSALNEAARYMSQAAASKIE